MLSNYMSTVTPAHHTEPAADLSASASELRIATFRLARRMRTQRAVDSMSDGQFAVLAGLFIHGSHTLGELADRERVSAPSMNRTVNCLQESGYVRRSADETDGRKVVISLTDEGRAVVDETARRRDAWVEEALADLTARERKTIADAAKIMQRMVAR
ncbi:MarR family transcriptional regulator [Microbacterium pumilum]|uniref:MarR family transcriptional regulator n=2 Tax=Microbacterium pumilum TaxID=344165 RepID=A0ABN2RTR6_9MICO